MYKEKPLFLSDSSEYVGQSGNCFTYSCVYVDHPYSLLSFYIGASNIIKPAVILEEVFCPIPLEQISKVHKETLQQSLLRDIKPCKVDQFRCSNSQCIDGHGLCDGSRNCYDGSDERLCDEYGCSGSRPIACKKGSYYKCLPPSFVCNGHHDCKDHSDERNCREGIKTYMSASFVHRGKYLAQNWMHQLRRKEQPLRKWGADVRQDCSGPLPVG
ncbi:hypothetical protein AVEN_260959-2 [Araneus ventricosus]|uniref:Uncharacterized protein n=1 Tax=Araneus ventricosus TaxID=182803 RepID=A0A4Y2TGL1_ARAVE|nr:hypothetical protein AVEN_260959-2 [Araneus ventricosus]